MRKILLLLVILISFGSFSQGGMWDIFSAKGSYSPYYGNAFESEEKYYAAHGTYSHLFHIKDHTRKEGTAYGVNISIAYGVWEYIGVSLDGNISGIKHNSTELKTSKTRYYTIGLSGNFHFLKLIDDRSSKLDVKDLDLYIGTNFGIGGGTNTYINQIDEKNVNNFGIFYAGGHFGLRWFPGGKAVGISTEVGYGKSIAQIGIIVR